MGKKRKTRQEKIIADLKRKLILETNQVSVFPNKKPQEILSTRESIDRTPTYAFDAISVKTTSVSQKAISQNFFLSDILKTAIVTSSIVFAELVLFFLLKIK